MECCNTLYDSFLPFEDGIRDVTLKTIANEKDIFENMVQYFSDERPTKSCNSSAGVPIQNA